MSKACEMVLWGHPRSSSAFIQGVHQQTVILAGILWLFLDFRCWNVCSMWINCTFLVLLVQRIVQSPNRSDSWRWSRKAGKLGKAFNTGLIVSLLNISRFIVPCTNISVYWWNIDMWSNLLILERSLVVWLFMTALPPEAEAWSMPAEIRGPH
jgi:hypothetical protein